MLVIDDNNETVPSDRFMKQKIYSHWRYNWTSEFEELPPEAKRSLYYSSGVDAILKPLADIHYERAISYYSGFDTGLGYFRYGFVWYDDETSVNETTNAAAPLPPDPPPAPSEEWCEE